MKDKNGTTMHEFASVDDDKGGRWSKQSETTNIATSPNSYPKGPDWCGQDAMVPDEGPLNYSVNDLEPVGTPAEVEASLKSLPEVVAPTRVVPAIVVLETASGKTPSTDLLDNL